jgi:RNA polymerase sigma-70 factor (ECF subfamily)
MKEVPDGLLVAQALAGDQDAFELLVTRYQRQLVVLIQGFLKDHDQSYDVLQQVNLQLYLSLPILFRNVSLKGWLFQVARNRCLDELRKRPELSFSTIEREDGEEGLSSLEVLPDPEPLPECDRRWASSRTALAKASEASWGRLWPAPCTW